MNENNHIVWVTGASKGIGLACSKTLAEAGMHVIMSSRSRPQLIDAAAAIRSGGYDARALQCDVSSEDDVQWAIKSIVKAFGEGPDILINNAGISPYEDI